MWTWEVWVCVWRVNLGAQGYNTSILHVAVSQFTSVIEKIADARAEAVRANRSCGNGTSSIILPA